MKAKELKEALLGIPDDAEIEIEFQREDGEIIYGKTFEFDQGTEVIVCKEMKLSPKDILYRYE